MIFNLARYKTYANISGYDYDTILTDIIEGVEKEIQNFLKHSLITSSYTETLDGSGSYKLMLREYPITAITSISEWDGDSWNTLTEGTDYDRLVIVDQNHIELEGKLFTESPNKYKVVYTAGYADADSVPVDIKLAAYRLVKLAWDETPMGRSALGVTSRSDSGGIESNTVLDKDERADIFKRIEHYRNVNV